MVAALSRDPALVALAWDGSAFSERWSTPVGDRSGMAGATAFDFDGDGAAELVYRDESLVYLIDGSNGTVLWSSPTTSNTIDEHPIVADIDGDCGAEIVVSGASYSPDASTVEAFDCDDAMTPRPIWNQFLYHATGVMDDGRIPRVPVPPWSAGPGAPWLAQTGSNADLAPPDLGNTLLGVRALLDVVLSWRAQPAAQDYLLRRGIAKGTWPPAPLRTGMRVPAATERDVPGPPDLYYYRVAGAACSGREGP